MVDKTYLDKNTTGDNEARKFGSTANGRVGLRVFSDGPLQVTSDDVSYDRIDATYPNDFTEIYTYSLAAIDVQVTTVVYSNATKTTLISMVKNVL